MPARTALILLCALLMSTAWGQQPSPPPGLEQAVRGRVTEFLQYHVDGNFRKAYDMVAEDTKDDYFATGKVQIKGFTVDTIEFSDNFTKARVTGTIAKMFNVQGVDLPVTMPSTTTWKIENGKWVWYNDARGASAMPMGLSIPAAPAAAPQSAPTDGGLPQKFDDKTIAAAARNILQQVSVDKKEITLAADKASEDRVVFHNGMNGSVQLELLAPEVPGFSAKLEQSIVRASTEVGVVFRYAPVNGVQRKDPIDVQLLVQPLNQTFPIRIHLLPPGPLK